MKRVRLVLALIAALPLTAQSAKEPWALSLDERIALRTDPTLARERVRTAKRPQTPGTPSVNSAHGTSADDFDGRTHPELFLPTEVFRKLIKLAFLSSPRTTEVIQEGLLPEIQRHRMPADFWERLRSVSAAYIADSWAERDLGDSVREQNGTARKQNDVCRNRADALAAARNEFGREAFDRFMYEVIAVNMFHSADRLPDPALVRKVERGCR